MKDQEQFYPESREAWRSWLQQHHTTKLSVWLIYYQKKLNQPTITWSEAVDEALCFGWIDSKRISLGDGRFAQFFCKRKPHGGWSKINKTKVQHLIDTGLMAPAGYACIQAAQQNGSWAMLDEVEALLVPHDLMAELMEHPGAEDYFTGLSRSVKKAMLQWIAFAKRAETRQKRIAEIAVLAAQHKKPKQF